MTDEEGGSMVDDWVLQHDYWDCLLNSIARTT